jgi:hypothetical protein
VGEKSRANVGETNDDPCEIWGMTADASDSGTLKKVGDVERRACKEKSKTREYID